MRRERIKEGKMMVIPGKKKVGTVKRARLVTMGGKRLVALGKGTVVTLDGGER